MNERYCVMCKEKLWAHPIYRIKVGERCTKRTESYRRRIAFKHDGSTEEITSR